MTEFSMFIERWHDFYFALSGVAATLLGLLFVAISLNVEILNRHKFADLLQISTQTFLNFLYLLVLGLLFLIPDQSPTGVGIPLLVIGLFGIVDVLRQIVHVRQNPEHLLRSLNLYTPFVLTIISFFILIVVGVLVLAGQTQAVSWLVAAAGLLLVSATRTAWDFLIRSRQSLRPASGETHTAPDKH